MLKINFRLLICILFLPVFLFSQHRGDNLSFQGLPLQNDISVKATAMGGAYTSMTGDLNSIYYNPAGLADISDFQITIGANLYSKLWQENQAYRPNRLYWTMAFYLDGLYIPDPKNNGVWDYELAQDSTYIVNPPKLGNEPYSEDAADWQNKNNDFKLNNFALAYPFDLMDNKITVSASYQKSPFLDYDRNDTYLDPHIGYDEYGPIPRVVTDTVSFSWSRFERKRVGWLQDIKLAVAYDLNEEFNLGIGFNLLNGETNDSQFLNRVGVFDIAKDNRFRFTYDTLNIHLSGKSKFEAINMNLGATLNLDNVSIGVNISTPYTMNRNWDYTYMTTDTSGSIESKKSGKDKFEFPASYTFGASITPVDQFTISFDYQFTNFSQGKFKITSLDTLHRDWIDQHIIRFGLQYRPFDFLSLLAGYREIPATFIPDGAAIKDAGPDTKSYTLGFSLKLFSYGQLDAAYDIRQFKYYDSYFSNTNYVYESLTNFMVAYTYFFE